MDIVEFLTARYDEDEARERDRLKRAARMKMALVRSAEGFHVAAPAPAPVEWNRALSEIAAKRRRLARHWSGGGMFCVACDGAWPCDDVLNDASVYIDHPDHDQDWAIIL